MTISINNSGTPRTVKTLYTNLSGVWKTVKSVWEKNSGTWVSPYGPASTGLVGFGNGAPNPNTSTRAGAFYSWIVPAGVTSITVNAVGGGGGGYAYHGSGYDEHAWSGAPGSGALNVIIPVAAGDVISGYYGDAGGTGYYNGGTGGSGSATTVYKNGTLIINAGAGSNGNVQPPTAGAVTIASGYVGTPVYPPAVQTGYVNSSDGAYPYYNNHYDAWSWVIEGNASYPLTVLGTPSIAAPYVISGFQYAGYGQTNGWVSIQW